MKFWAKGHPYGANKTGSFELLCESPCTLTCTGQWAAFLFSIQFKKTGQQKQTWENNKAAWRQPGSHMPAT